ncbi:MAG TPA: FixH family protein, partial [Terriglobales bacterium]|nr:FixH family protein [Terriglobales bacterium]
MSEKLALRRWVTVVACLLLLVGCKKQEEQPKSEVKKSGIIATQAAPGSAFKMSLDLEPPQPQFGDKTRFRVKVSDPAGAPVSGAQVHAKLVMPLMDMGKNEFDLADKGKGEYEGTGEFTMAGEWVATITAKQGE